MKEITIEAIEANFRALIKARIKRFVLLNILQEEYIFVIPGAVNYVYPHNTYEGILIVPDRSANSILLIKAEDYQQNVI